MSVPHAVVEPRSPAISVSRLFKKYDNKIAVDDISFDVGEGEIVGLLGPNGAGKTTVAECLLGLRSPDSGQLKLLGLDPRSDRAALRMIVGAQLQSSALPGKLKVREILELYASFYAEPMDEIELLTALGLVEKQQSFYGTLSGGQKQRLSVALAFVGRPKIAILDEMTTGLDPQSRRDTWDLVARARDRGTTVLLVTHFMEEAQRLCDRVALIDAGKLVAMDSPDKIAEQAGGGKRVRFRPSQPFEDRVLTERPEVRSVTRDGAEVVASGTGDLVNAVILTLAAAGISAHDVQLERATLEDAFVQLTGRHIKPAQESSLHE